MTKQEKQEKVMELVEKICEMESTNCRSLNKKELAIKLMKLANISEHSVEIVEIPVDWDNQVIVAYVSKNKNNNYYYELFAGTDKDGKFHFQIDITGVCKKDRFGDTYFDFFNYEKNFIPVWSI